MAFGLHYTDAVAGRVFSQVGTALGLAIPIYTGTALAGGMPLWNPPNSNRNVEVIGADFNTASGTAVYGSICIMGVPLNAVATGAPVTAFAATTPVNGLLGAGNASKCLSSNAGTVTATAGAAANPTSTTPGMIRGVAQINGEGAAAGLHTANVCHFDFQGTLIIPPGWMIYFACTLASVALITSTLVWKEIPINAAAG